MNVQALLKQAQKMQSSLTKAEKELNERIYEVENEFVTVKCDGSYHIKNIEFKENASEDIEMLQDMIVVAVNKVIEQAKEEHEQVLSQITGGVKMPGVF